jgi:hypothetical protein
VGSTGKGACVWTFTVVKKEGCSEKSWYGCGRWSGRGGESESESGGDCDHCAKNVGESGKLELEDLAAISIFGGAVATDSAFAASRNILKEWTWWLPGPVGLKM